MHKPVFRNNLQERLFNYAVNTIGLIRILPKGKEYDVISWQLVKSSTSCGANYAEAQSAVSKADFSNKVGIALKELRESNYWINLTIATLDDKNNWIILENESRELMNILGLIVVATT